MPGERFFFDTYALVERQMGSPAYKPYSEMPVFTHQFNLYEFASAIMKAADETRARKELALLSPNPLEAELDDLLVASRFRLDRAKQRISYVDALGYTLARKHEMKFLTGDKAFKGVEGVELVP